jgi:hypothetical protein
MRGQLAELWKHQSRSANEAKFTAADLDRKLVTKERELAKLRERCEKVRASHRMAQAQLQQVSRVCPSQCDAMACKPIQCAMHCCAVLCCAVLCGTARESIAIIRSHSTLRGDGAVFPQD